MHQTDALGTVTSQSLKRHMEVNIPWVRPAQATAALQQKPTP